MVQRATACSCASGAASSRQRLDEGQRPVQQRTIAAAASSSFELKCLYRLALAMPTSAATSSTVIRSKPLSASRRMTDDTIASSRTRCICSFSGTRVITAF